MFLRRSIAVGLLLCLVLQLQTWALCGMLNQPTEQGASSTPCCSSSCCPSDVEDRTVPLVPDDGDCSLCDMKDLLGKVILSKSIDFDEAESLVVRFVELLEECERDINVGSVSVVRIEPPPLWIESSRSGVFLI